MAAYPCDILQLQYYGFCSEVPFGKGERFSSVKSP